MSPALRRMHCVSLSPLMASLSEALSPFSAVVLTGGSSGIGKSFIELMGTLKRELIFCNISRLELSRKISGFQELNLNHFPCDLLRTGEVARVAGEIIARVDAQSPTGEILQTWMGARVPKPFAARVSGVILTRMRGGRAR